MFFVAFPLEAQSGILAAADISAEKEFFYADSIYQSRPAYKKFDTVGWQGFEREEVDRYYEKNRILFTWARLKAVMHEFYKVADFFTFGEAHTRPVPAYMMFLDIAEHNAAAESKERIKNIFLEMHADDHSYFYRNIQTFESNFSAGEKESFCAVWLAENLGGEYRESAVRASYAHCLAVESGAKIYFVDMPVDEKTCPECGHWECNLKGSRVSSTGRKGMGIRNCAMAEKIKEILAASPGKSAYFGGAGHLGYGSVAEFLTLSEELDRFMAGKKVLNFFISGGKKYDEEIYEAKLKCPSCTAFSWGKSPGMHLVELGLERVDEVAISLLPVVPVKAGVEEKQVYEEGRIADFIIAFPESFDYSRYEN